GAILVFTVFSAIINVVVDQVLPMIRGTGELALPPVSDITYWQYVAFAALAYLVGLTVLYILKAILLPR
ncbi:MAG: hypothetical protein ACOC20_06660, partial [Oceanicaulis sp.]